MEGFLTLTEMAYRIGLKDTANLRRDIKDGRLAAVLIGKTYLVTEAEYSRYKTARRPRGRPPHDRNAMADERGSE